MLEEAREVVGTSHSCKKEASLVLWICRRGEALKNAVTTGKISVRSQNQATSMKTLRTRELKLSLTEESSPSDQVAGVRE